jgi:hypothetical protein
MSTSDSIQICAEVCTGSELGNYLKWRVGTYVRIGPEKSNFRPDSNFLNSNMFY